MSGEHGCLWGTEAWDRMGYFFMMARLDEEIKGPGKQPCKGYAMTRVH